MSFWVGSLIGFLIGAPIGGVMAYYWPRHRKPLGTADAPVDKMIRRLHLRGVIRDLHARLGTFRLALLSIAAALLVTLLVGVGVLSAEWNTAKDATEKADRALSCQQFNDRESTRAQILAAEANIQQRSDQIGFLTAQRAFLAPLAPGLPRDAAEVAKRFHDYLVSLNDAIVSLERANQSGAKLIKELKERDIECIRDASGAPR